jgi:myo-inositol-1(or 4)-monophosphatase
VSRAAAGACDPLSVARAAALCAGELLRARARRPHQGVRRKDAAGELVSDADVAAEAEIIGIIRRHYPDDRILTEEAGELGGSGERRWIVDPLDGSGNFLAGVPLWTVSVAVEQHGAPAAGVVYDPMRDECFSVAAGDVPRCNGTPIRGSAGSRLGEAVVATGLATDRRRRAAEIRLLSRLLPAVRDVRRTGSAALDLAWTACGRFDAYFELSLQPWDWAAGALLAEAAGLRVERLAPGEDGRSGVLAAPTALATPLRECIEAGGRP